MTKPKIGAKEALDDIRAGLDDTALMKKYRLSAKGLHSLIRKLVDAGVLEQSELEKRASEPEGSVIIDYSTLTMEDAARPESPLAGESPSRDAKSALLLSDDNELLVHLEEFLAPDEVHFHVCIDGAIDPELLRRISPHVLIVDVDRYAASCSDVITMTSQFDESIATLLLSDSTRRQDVLKWMGEGAYDFLERPLGGHRLASTLRRAVQHCELMRFKRDHSRIMEQAIKEQTLEMVKTKDFLNGILDSSTLVSVVLTDLDQRVRFWNKGAENIFGYTAEEMIGQKITRIYPPDGLTHDVVEELRGLVANKTGTVHAKMKQVAKGGRVLTISLGLTPMVDGSGEFQGILGMGLDVTEEVQRNREILKLLQKLKQTQDVTILTLVRLAEDREGESGSKLIRIQEYCRALSSHLAKRPEYEGILTQRYIDDLVRSAVLYDVGKVALSDSVLLYAGEFGPKEREEMRRHPLYGGKALQEAVKKLGPESFLTLGMEMAFYHHEHWDGSGYPFGLKDQEIPLSARIVAIADVYDALTSDRRHRHAFSHEEACGLMVDLKGKQFDPVIVDEFQALQGEFQMIRKVYSE